MRTVQHAVIAEQRIHMPNRILENLARVEWLVGFLVYPFTEDQLAEDRFRVGCYLAFEILLDLWREARGGRDGGCVGDGGG